MDKFIKVGLDKLDGNINKTWRELGQELNIPYKTLKTKVRSYCLQNGLHSEIYGVRIMHDRNTGEPIKKKITAENINEHYNNSNNELNNNKKTVTINKDGSQDSERLIAMNENNAKDAKFLLEAHGYNIYEWELVSARSNIWNVYSKQDGINELYSSKIVVKPKKDDVNIEELAKQFNNLIKEYKIPYVAKRELTSEFVGEIPIMDLHLGKMSWNGETNEDYDFKIARERFYSVISDLKDKIKINKPEKIIFPIGQDFFNFDTIDGTTTKGTRQDNDLRWSKLFMVGAEMLVNAISMVKEVAPIDTFYISSNHSKMTDFYALMYISAFFRNDENVIVDTSPIGRKYRSFGKCLIGYSHGEAEKNRLDGLMQCEVPKLWGNSLFREWHLGHFHSENLYIDEKNGIIKRRISSITGTDAWHFDSAYVGAIKKHRLLIGIKNME